MNKQDSVKVLGIDLRIVSLHELLNLAAKHAHRGDSQTWMYLNIHVANKAKRNPALFNALRSADLVYCDGEGVRLGVRLLGRRIPPRMTGADFIWDLAKRCADENLRLYWLGARDNVAEEAMRVLGKRFPGLPKAGSHHGYFAKTDAESRKVIEKINSTQPHILLVGMGTPTQELWVQKHRALIKVPIVWCIGATADFVSGKQPRAPRWMLDHGMEWLFRLAWEPRRLFGRYLMGNPLFFSRVIAQKFRASREDLPHRRR